MCRVIMSHCKGKNNVKKRNARRKKNERLELEKAAKSGQS